MSEVPRRLDLWDPLDAREASHSDAQNVGPRLCNPGEAVQDDGRDQENRHGETACGDEDSDCPFCTTKRAIRSRD
jgi:hypothetical protein